MKQPTTLWKKSWWVLLGILCCPVLANAQFRIEDFQQNGVGLGLWYGVGQLTFDSATGGASNKVKGYTAVLPATAQGQGAAIGVSYGSFGVNFGFDIGENRINKLADLQQDDDPSNDIYVLKARRYNHSIAILVQPIRYFYLGRGVDQGNFEFVERSVGEKRQTTRVGYENEFYSFGVALGFDPTNSLVAPIFTLYGKIPVRRADFSGTLAGVGLGLYW